MTAVYLVTSATKEQGGVLLRLTRRGNGTRWLAVVYCTVRVFGDAKRVAAQKKRHRPMMTDGV